MAKRTAHDILTRNHRTAGPATRSGKHIHALAGQD